MEVQRNTELGAIKINIRKEHIGPHQNGVIIILQAYEGGDLKCTAIEITENKDLFSDPTFRKLLEFSDNHQGLVQYSDISKLMQKYKFPQHELLLKI